MSCKGEAVLQLLTATQSFLILSFSEGQGPKPGYMSVGEERKARSKQAFFFFLRKHKTRTLKFKSTLNSFLQYL